MKKQSNVLIPFLAIGVVFALGYKGFGWENNLKKNAAVRTVNSFVTSEAIEHEAWRVFENYLKFARLHNLAGVKSLSHQISATCNDPLRIEECFALMDNVYGILSPFQQSDFRHIEEDNRQIVMYTDGPVVAILFFTKDLDGALKVLGLRFCLEVEDEGAEPCVEADQIRGDQDGNGWWDSVESLFY